MSSTSSPSSALRSHLECPICMIIPHGMHIYVCMQGHDICSRCFDQLLAPKGSKKSCPQGRCKYAEPILRNRTVENIVAESGFDMACEFSADGCNFAGSFRDVKAHEPKCPFSHLKAACPEAGSGSSCSARLHVRELVAHLRAEHPNVVFSDSPNGGVVAKNACVQKWLMKQEMHLQSSAAGSGGGGGKSYTSWNMVVSRLHGECFGIRFLKKGDVWFTWITMFGEEEDCSRFACKITVAKGGCGDRTAASKYSYEGHVPSIRSAPDVIMESGACLTLTRDMVMKCVSCGNISDASRKSGFDRQLSVEYEVRKIPGSKRRPAAASSSSSLPLGGIASRVNQKIVGGRR